MECFASLLGIMWPLRFTSLRYLIHKHHNLTLHEMVWKVLLVFKLAIVSSDCEVPARSNQLLQTNAASHNVRRTSPIFHFDDTKMWGLDKNLSWRVSKSDCKLQFPSIENASRKIESRLSLGVCLTPWTPLQRWRLDLALPASHGRTHPGANPSMIPLPETLQEVFPFGKWFVVSRPGWARCPGMQDFDHGRDGPFLINLWCSGSHAAVLDAEFNVEAVSKIQLEGVEGAWWDNAISDVRLWPSGDGEIIVSFLPYLFHEVYHTHMAKLYVSGADGVLNVWIDPREVRRAESCHNKKVAKKNLGFFRSGSDVFLLDKVFPTAVSAMNLSLLDRDSELEIENSHTYMPEANEGWKPVTLPSICMKSVVTGNESSHSPWYGCRGQEHDTFLHNGPSPIWIQEMQVFLGIGHLARGTRPSLTLRFLPDHYSHQFFAISASPPFRLVALSPEFCFSSAQDPGDCENIQYASTLLRDGDHLLVAYGVEDCDSYVQQFLLSDILHSMVNVSDEI